MTDEEPVIVGRELHDEIVADGEYMAVIGPFLFQMLILEAKVVQLVVGLFETPGSIEARRLEAVMFDRQTAGTKLDILQRAIREFGLDTDDVRKAISNARRAVSIRNDVSHQLPAFDLMSDELSFHWQSPKSIRVRSLSDLRAAVTEARNAWMELERVITLEQLRKSGERSNDGTR